MFELNPPTVLDPGHTTTILTANQTLQFARPVSLEVTLVSQGLSEDLLFRSRRLGAPGSRGLPGSPFPVAIGFFLGDSIASQSRFSLSTVTGMTVTSGSGAVTDLRSSSVDVRSSCHERAFVDAVDLEDVQQAVIADQEKVARVKGKKKVAEPYKMSYEGRPNPFPKCKIDEGGWIFLEERLQRVPWAKVFATGHEDPLNYRQKFYCMDCHVSMRARGVYEIQRHYQSPNYLRQEQPFR